MLGIIEMIGVVGVLDEEVFGLFLCVWCYDFFEEVILMVNNICFGFFCGLVFFEWEKFD